VVAQFKQQEEFHSYILLRGRTIQTVLH